MFDPHRKEREEQITNVIKPLISEALADMEPPMRDGLAKAYARKFTGAQLTDLNSFLATPTGKLYADEWMALQADPEVMVRSEEHTSDLQSLMRISYAVFCLKKKQYTT